MKGKNKRKQRHDCSKRKSELGAQAAPASKFEDSMSSSNLSGAIPLNQTLYEPNEFSYDKDAAAQEPICKGNEKLAQGAVGSKFYQEKKQVLNQPREGDERAPTLSGPIITDFHNTVKQDLNDHGMDQCDAKQSLIEIAINRVREENNIEKEAKEILD